MDATPADLIRVAKEFGFEGIVAKRKSSLYEPGKRSGAWLKYRVNKGQEFVIGGYVPDNPFDSIIVGYYQGGKLLYAAKVRNGFVSNTRREVAAKLKGLQIDACPFANLPERKRTQWALTREEMKTASGLSLNWSRRSSSVNGRQTVTCGIQSLWDCETTRKLTTLYARDKVYPVFLVSAY